MMSSRKPILLATVGISALLIGISAILPSASDRRVEERRRRLTVLTKIASPPLPATPAIATGWDEGYSQERGRDVTSHFYHRLGAKSLRTDLFYGLSTSRGRSRTIVHLAFDPAKPEHVRLATAFALAVRGLDPSGSLLHNVLSGKASGNKTVRQQVAGVEKRAGAKRLADTRQALLAEVGGGSTSAHPTETSLLEVEGRFYREPKSKLSSAVPYTGVATERYEFVEALADPAVRLP